MHTPEGVHIGWPLRGTVGKIFQPGRSNAAHWEQDIPWWTDKGWICKHHYWRVPRNSSSVLRSLSKNLKVAIALLEIALTG